METGQVVSKPYVAKLRSMEQIINSVVICTEKQVKYNQHEAN